MIRGDSELPPDHCKLQLVFFNKESEILWKWKKSYHKDLESALQTTQKNGRPRCACEWVGVFIQIQYGLPFNTSCLFLSLFTMSSKDENNKVA